VDFVISMPKQIPLIGGPLDGQVHSMIGEVKPAMIAPRTEDGFAHWYELLDGRGYYAFSKNEVTGERVELPPGSAE
jgi:hypothetical protein